MIVSKLQFLEVEGEPLRGNAMVFHDALLGVAPEPLQAIDVYPASEVFFQGFLPMSAVEAFYVWILDRFSRSEKIQL